ncbi:MAG: acyl-CoA dehydrogenase family protein, partial [Actinomycetota bacterium]|nr:acyl-CoA dehydrogenase family protein [Actinomycetota bacterium]
GEMRAAEVVGTQLAARVATGIRTGTMNSNSGSLLKLYTADLHLRRCEVAIDLAGAASVAWGDGDGNAEEHALKYLTRQGTSIMGGTNEIQRNIISERVLDLPREAAPDKDMPFNQVPSGRTTA